MAYELIKVSELPELTAPSDPNVIPIQDGDYLKRISFENLKEAVTGDVAGDLAAEVTARESAVSGEATARGNADTAILADLASPYSASSTYAVGDYCTKDEQLYRCTTAITTAEAWTAAHWSAVALGDDTRDLRSALSSVENELDDYAKKDGTYEDLTSGNAEQLLSDVYAENSEPYLFRKTGGSDKVGSREYLDKIVGGSLAVNQLAQNGNFADGTTGWQPYSNIGQISAANGELTYTILSPGSTPYGNTCALAERMYYDGHVYLSVYDIYVDRICSVNKIYIGTAVATEANVGWNRIYGLLRKNTTEEIRAFYGIRNASANNWAVNDTYKIKNVNIIDLTAEFGSTIADYVYSLETATAGSGVAWLRQYIDIDSYHPYSEPTLKHVEGLASHDTVGLNQWNEDWEVGTYGNNGGILVYGAASYNTMIRCKTPIRVLSNTTYVFYCNDPNYNAGFWVLESEGIGKPITGTNMTSSGRFMTYTTTAKATHLVFATRTGYGNVYKHDVSVHIRGDGTKNEVYEPYQKHSYPLDSSVVLRGIPTLVDGKLKYDGDEYLPDGTINRRYGIVDLGTLTWSEFSSSESRVVFSAIVSTIKAIPNGSTIPNILAVGYKAVSQNAAWTPGDIAQTAGTNPTKVYCTVSAGTTVSDFETAMSGVYLVYELETPTTETAEPYRQLQICDTYGTEEFVTTSEVPVGTETRYPEDLKSKIEGLPWDLSMIAPIENGTTASQAYTTGQYFLRNNVFCKAKTSIASGATFTLNTNYEETTIAAELYTALH